MTKVGFARLLAGAAIAAVLPSPALRAQAGAPYSETVEVRVINLEVVVTDRQGLPVTGLGPKHFLLTVDGKEIPIEFFTEVRGGGAVEGPSEGAAIPGVPQLAPGTPVGTSYLVFIDDFFAIERDRNHVLEKLIAELPQLRPEDRMAVVAFDGRQIDMLSTWSRSTAELERVLKKATSRKAGGLQRVAEDRRFHDERRLMSMPSGPRGFIDSTQMRLDVEERNYAETLEEQVEHVVSAAAASLRGFAKPPGRKVLLLLSGGWPFDVVDFVVNNYNRTVVESDIARGDQLFEPLIATANQLGYTIYGVDVPGMMGDSAINAEFGAAANFVDRRQQFQRESNLQYSLEAVSRATGGEALLNGQRDKALSAAVSDTRSYYWLGFTPPWEGSDSNHDVKVETTVDGLRVRSRSGYVDFSTRRETTMAVESVLLFGDRPDMIPLAVSIGAVEKASMGKMKVPVTIQIPLDRLTLIPQGEKLVADVELRVAALDERGGRSEVPVIPVSMTLSGPPPAGATASYTASPQLRRGRNQLVIAVSDPVSGVIYSGRAEVAWK
jgi:VWFA-related protein